MKLLSFTVERFWGETPLNVALGVRSDRGAPEPNMAFLAGPNGSGKSRTLEAIGHVFWALSADVRPSFDFELVYEIGDLRVRVTTAKPRELSDDQASRTRVASLGVWIFISDRLGSVWRVEDARDRVPGPAAGWLPSRVIGVSSGPTSRLRRVLGAVPGGSGIADGEADSPPTEVLSEVDQPRCLALGPDELALAILAFATHPVPGTSPARPYLDALTSADLDSASPVAAFVIEVVGDFSSKARAEASQIRRLLGKAEWSIAGYHGQLDEEASSRRYTFIVSAGFRNWLASYSSTGTTWFDRLVGWRRRGVVRDVKLVLRGAGTSAGLSVHDELSDGQFLRIGRYALLSLIAPEGESLLLLDEPETHFNDRWRVELVRDLADLLRGGSGSDDVLIATHSDVTLTDADEADVFVIEGEAVGPPNFSPLAADRQEVARAVGVDSGVGLRVLAEIDEVLRGGEPGAIRSMLSRVGPGYHRFRLAYALRESDSDAPTP